MLLEFAPQFCGYNHSSYGKVYVCDQYYYAKTLKGKDVTTFTMGADVASVKYATFAGGLTDEQIAENAQGIFSGDIESKHTHYQHLQHCCQQQH